MVALLEEGIAQGVFVACNVNVMAFTLDPGMPSRRPGGIGTGAERRRAKSPTSSQDCSCGD